MNFSPMNTSDADTIAAIATPVGSGGIGIIRISGARAVAIANGLFRPERECRCLGIECLLDQVPSHVLKHGFLYEPDTQSIVDEVLLVVMKAPRSYTCEDVVEIQSHSGPFILAKILGLVMARGARLALPGEFTKRAFLNGRIDLSQAEAVGDMISAKSESALKLATNHLTGAMRDKVLGMIDWITDMQAVMEAALEFAEDVGDAGGDWAHGIQGIRSHLVEPIEQLLERYEEGRFLRDGVRLGIAGRPNVGKSSLLNYLACKDKAIVTALAGTTRDLIEEHISINGVPVILTDTAGLRDTVEPIELAGIQKARESIAQADLVLFMIDGQEPFDQGDRVAFSQIEAQNILILVNKVDLMTNPGELIIPDPFNAFPVVYVSAKYGHGIKELKAVIQDRCSGTSGLDPGRAVIPNIRQKALLQFAGQRLNDIIGLMQRRTGEELIVGDLALVKDALNEIIGYHPSGDLLDEIFSRFCIGK
jgi:tRNA modification GTPase